MGRQTGRAAEGGGTGPENDRTVDDQALHDGGATEGADAGVLGGGVVDGREPVAFQTALIASLPGGAVFVVDHGLRYQLADGEALYAAGLRPSDLVGRTIFEALEPTLAESYAPMYRRALAGETFAHEHAAHGRVFISRGGPLRDVTGAVDGALAVSYDITDRQLAEDALRASETRFRTVQDASPLGFCIHRPIREGDRADGRVLDFAIPYVNETGARIVGLSREQVMAGTLLTIWPATAAEGVLADYVRVLETGAPSHRELLYEHDELVAGLALTTVRIGEGPWAELGITFTDVSARLRAERERERLLRALEVERARLANVFRQAPTFLAVLRGPEHVFELVNDAYDQLVAGRDVVGRPLADALPETVTQGFVDLLDRVFTTGEPFIGREVPIHLQQRAGAPLEEHFLDFVYQPLTEADGTRSGVVVHGSDVTEQVRARREIERLLADSERARAEADGARREADEARRAAEDADRAKSEFLATMSHEIRTPINAILGYGELLDLGIAGPVTGQQHDYLARLRTSSRHLLGLVNEVLDLAKVDAGQMPVAREHAATGETITETLAIVLPQAEAKGVSVRDGQPGDPGAPYVGDAHRVRQILVNILSNAVKFTPAGGMVTVICGIDTHGPPEARLVGAGPWTYITVEDTGIGIAPEHHAAIFEPFVQAEPGRTRTAGGTGLGLAISRRLARLMGGDLVLERSAPGAGSRFTLWLPAVTDVGTEGDDRPESAAARGARASGAVAGYRVYGVAEVGAHLRAHVEEVLESFVARLRNDPVIPMARGRDRAELEDHTATLLGNLAQSLVLIERAGGVESVLLKDGGEIQRVVADLHGRSRRLLGWTEAALAREYEVLAVEVTGMVRRRVPEGTGDVDTALDVIGRLLVRAAEASARAFRHATDAEA